MTADTTGTENDRLFCWEQVARTNRLFRVSHVFAPPDLADRLLALYALFSVVEQICSVHSDDEVARHKLNWWRLECLHQDLNESRHPVIRELVRTGASEDLDRQSLAGLLDAVEGRLDVPAPANVEELRTRCRALFQPQLELEAQAGGIAREELDWSLETAAGCGLFLLIRENSAKRAEMACRWLPHDLRAKHGVSLENIAQAPRSAPVVDLFAEMMNAGLSWGSEPNRKPSNDSSARLKTRHLHVISSLYRRKLKKMSKLSPDRHGDELNRIGPGDLFNAWKTARGAS